MAVWRSCVLGCGTGSGCRLEGELFLSQKCSSFPLHGSSSCNGGNSKRGLAICLFFSWFLFFRLFVWYVSGGIRWKDGVVGMQKKEQPGQDVPLEGQQVCSEAGGGDWKGHNGIAL